MELFNHYLLTKEATKLLFENDTVPTSAFQWKYDQLHRIHIATMDEMLQIFAHFIILKSILSSTIVLARHEYTPEVENSLLKLQQQFEENEHNFQIYLVDEKNKQKIYQELFEPDVNLTSSWLMYLQGFEPDDNYFLNNTKDLRDFWYDYGLALQNWFQHTENSQQKTGILGIRPNVTIDMEHVDITQMCVTTQHKIYLPMKNLPFSFFELEYDLNPQRSIQIYKHGGLLVPSKVKFSSDLTDNIQQFVQKNLIITPKEKIQNMTEFFSNLSTYHTIYQQPISRYKPSFGRFRNNDKEQKNPLKVACNIFQTILELVLVGDNLSEEKDDYCLIIKNDVITEFEFYHDPVSHETTINYPIASDIIDNQTLVIKQDDKKIFIIFEENSDNIIGATHEYHE